MTKATCPHCGQPMPGSADLLDFDRHFAAWWERYPEKVGKKAAKAEYHRILARGETTAAQLYDGLGRYMRSKPPERPWVHPLTWLRQGRWEDRPAPAPATEAPPRMIAAAEARVVFKPAPDPSSHLTPLERAAAVERVKARLAPGNGKA